MHQQSVRMFCPCVTCMQFHFSVALWYTGLYTWILNKIKMEYQSWKKLEIFQHHIMVASANGWTAPEIHSHLRWLIREPDTRSLNSHATRRCRGCSLKMLSHTICCLHNPESKKFMGRCFGLWELVFCRHCVKSTSILSAQEESHCLQNGTKGT